MSGHPEGWPLLEGGCRAMDRVEACGEGGLACGHSPGHQHRGDVCAMGRDGQCIPPGTGTGELGCALPGVKLLAGS